MPVDNVELLRRGFEAFNRGGIEGLIELIHPDFEAQAPPELTTEPGTYRGAEGLRRWFDGFEGIMEDIRFEPLDYIPSGDRVLVPVRLLARGRDSGIEVEQRSFQVWTLRDGKAIRLDTYADLDTAREAACLPT